MRLVSCSGLLLVEHLMRGGRGEKEQGIDVGNVGSGVGNKTVIALAEVMIPMRMVLELCPLGWKSGKKAFQPTGRSLKECHILYIADN